MKNHWKLAICGAIAGAVNGLLGAGGGMLLVPLLGRYYKDEKLFPASVCIILPLTVVSLLFQAGNQGIPWGTAWPYLIGSAAGGLTAGLWGHHIPTIWLHRILGILILWGGIRYLC